MAPEAAAPEDIEFYTPKELSALLSAADAKAEFKGLLPLIALCGLAACDRKKPPALT